MNIEWSCVLDIEEESRGFVDKIVEYRGLYYAIIFENAANKQHVAIFDEKGARHGEIRNAVSKSIIQVYNNGYLASKERPVTIYSLPDFSAHPTLINDIIGDITAVQSSGSLVSFCVYGFENIQTLYAITNAAEVVWKISVEKRMDIRGIFTANEYIVAAVHIHETLETYVLLFSLAGELVKTIDLNEGRAAPVFSNIKEQTGIQLDKEHILLIGDPSDRDRSWSRFAKVNIYTGHVELVDVPARAGDVRSLSMLPDGSLAFDASSTIFLLDANLKPYARFPEEQYPEIQPICSFLALPNGDFLIGAGVYDEKGLDKPWIGYVKRSVFVPCDTLY